MCKICKKESKKLVLHWDSTPHHVDPEEICGIKWPRHAHLGITYIPLTKCVYVHERDVDAYPESR
jgi:hypothetical protein